MIRFVGPHRLSLLWTERSCFKALHNSMRSIPSIHRNFVRGTKKTMIPQDTRAEIHQSRLSQFSLQVDFFTAKLPVINLNSALLKLVNVTPALKEGNF